MRSHFGIAANGDCIWLEIAAARPAGDPPRRRRGRLLELCLPARLRPLPRGESLHKLADVVNRPDHELYAALTAQWQDPRRVVIGAPDPITDPWLSRPEAEGLEDTV